MPALNVAVPWGSDSSAYFGGPVRCRGVATGSTAPARLHSQHLVLQSALQHTPVLHDAIQLQLQHPAGLPLEHVCSPHSLALLVVTMLCCRAACHRLRAAGLPSGHVPQQAGCKAQAMLCKSQPAGSSTACLTTASLRRRLVHARTTAGQGQLLERHRGHCV